ncbi:MAG: response regulator [Draconibacterium sp.]|nr:response regulator [Draconibacterium sp.]
MNEKNKIKLFLVDDDMLFLKSLEIDFLQHADFYLLDSIDKNAMNGIETLDKIKAFNPQIPVVMLSAQDKIEVAINCMHHKATDYVVKSETAFLRLQKIITTVMRFNKMEKQLNWYMERM